MIETLARNIDVLKKAEYPITLPNKESIVITPFYSSLLTNQREHYILEIENGGIMTRGKSLKSLYFTRGEIRVGDPKEGGEIWSSTFKLPENLELLSTDLEMWKHLNSTFRCAVTEYQETAAHALGLERKRDKFVYFSQGEDIVKDTKDQPKHLPRDFKDLEEMLIQVTNKLYNPRLHGVHAYFAGQTTNKAFANTEGSSFFTSYQRFSINLDILAVDDDNSVICNREVFHALDYDQIPTMETLLEKGEQLTAELFDTIKAPKEKNGAYPVIMDPENHGVLWHEVVGHALEGHRMQEDKWGGDETTLFKNRIGDIVAPEFLTLVDDPTVEGLDGSYKYDEEGVKAQRVVLIENGKLMNYLQSRQSAGFHKTKSNGHARAEDCDDPTPRMSNLFITSTNETSYEGLVEHLKKQIKDTPGVEYGLILEGSMGGFALPDDCYFNEFPKNVFRLYANGKKERVRPVFVVGTPLVTLQNIIKTSDEYSMFNGTCGAESGLIPSTETAPHALLSSLEVNPIPKSMYQTFYNPVIPKPKK